MHLEKITVHGFKAAAEFPLMCSLPGRFSVLVGANSTGKSTIIDSVVMAHRDVFPYSPRPTSAALSRTVPSRTIEISYAVDPDDSSPLGDMLARHGRIPQWTTELSSSMGRVSVSHTETQPSGQLPVMYLSPTRHPALDLSLPRFGGHRA